MNSQFVLLPARLFVAAVLILEVLGFKLPDRFKKSVGIFGICFFLARVIWLLWSELIPGVDFRVYWTAGHLALEGKNPWSYPEQFQLPLVYFPNSLPLMVGMAVLPFKQALVVWILIESALALVQIPLAARVLEIGQSEKGDRLGNPTLWLLTGVYCMSSDVALLTEVGQLSLVVSSTILLALAAFKRARLFVCGLLLSISAAKPTTMFPFLVLFLNIKSWKVWAGLFVGTTALCLIASPARELPTRVGQTLQLIRESVGEGSINDINYQENSDTRIGLDSMAYRWGITDRTAIKVIQGVIVLGMAAYLLAEVFLWKRHSREGFWCLVCLYSQIFVYHRIYDLVILALPLVFVVNMARSSEETGRKLWQFSGLLLVVALFPIRRVFHFIEVHSWNWGVVGPLARALVLPGVTYALLLAFAAIAVADALKGRAKLSAAGEVSQKPEGDVDRK